MDIAWTRIFTHLISVTVAYLLALPVAWDREKEVRSAGLRTFPLVAVSSCGYALIAMSILGSGADSSRDWAAKWTMLLGVRAVIAESFERIHRSNLIGMGVLPCRLNERVNARTLKLDGTETFDVGLKDGMEPREDLTQVIHRQNGESIDLPLTLRVETPVEVEYYRNGGILRYVLRQLLKKV